MSDANATSPNGRVTDGPMRWFLLTGNRLTVAALMLVGIAGLFVAAGLLNLATVTNPSRVLWFLNGTVNGLLTLVPISVGVNQIVLSHEFGSIQDLYERRKQIDQFRRQVESKSDEAVSSPRPSEFFRTLFGALSETATAFRRECERRGRATDEVEAYVRSVTEDADEARGELAPAETTTLDTLLVVLEYDDSVQFFEARRLNARDDLSDEAEAKLYRIEELFTEFDAARQYLKTVVVERQLARLSQLLVFTGIPAVAVAAVGIFTYRDVADLTLSHATLVLVAGTLVAASLVPLAVLSAYILRVATVARQTAAFGPFVPDSEFRSDDE